MDPIIDFNTINLPTDFKNFRPTLKVKSPGRINFIGEHTDYNNGFVMPTAINKYITFYLSKNDSKNICNIYSRTYEKSFSFDLRKISRSESVWENYMLGVVNEIQKLDRQLHGFDCVIESDLPVGAGISSSAALECGLGFGLDQLFHLGLRREVIAELSRNAEHNYVGTKCGIMDQFASILSKKGKVILLDCESMEPFYMPAEFSGYKVLLINTMVSHSLQNTEYNTRRAECELVVNIIKKDHPRVNSLRDIDLHLLNEYVEKLSETLYKRGVYIIKENQRVLDAAEALKKDDFHAFGKLMYLSHEGLKNHYEVSCRELDFLVDFTLNFDSVLGSRMMGGGFGGCTINLVKEDKADEFIELAKKAYFQEFQIEAQVIKVQPSGGTRLVNL